MKKRNILKTITVTVLCAMLVACGPTEDKLMEAEEARTVLLDSRKAAEETFLDITDSSNKDRLEELSQKTAEIEAMDLSKLNDKKIDELLSSINALTKEYQTMGSDMTAVLNEEISVRQEKAKHLQKDVNFINKTGMNLSGLLLHDLTMDSYSDNFIGSGVTLNDGYTLMGATLDVYEDSNEWEFVITSEGGTNYILTCGNLKELDQNGVTIVLEYDANTKEGNAQVPTKEEIDEEGQEETDEITDIPEEAASTEESTEN